MPVHTLISTFRPARSIPKPKPLATVLYDSPRNLRPTLLDQSRMTRTQFGNALAAIRAAARLHLDLTRTRTAQKKKSLRKFFVEIHQNFPLLRTFEQDWFAICYLTMFLTGQNHINRQKTDKPLESDENIEIASASHVDGGFKAHPDIDLEHDPGKVATVAPAAPRALHSRQESKPLHARSLNRPVVVIDSDSESESGAAMQPPCASASNRSALRAATPVLPQAPAASSALKVVPPSASSAVIPKDPIMDFVTSFPEGPLPELAPVLRASGINSQARLRAWAHEEHDGGPLFGRLALRKLMTEWDICVVQRGLTRIISADLNAAVQ